MFYSSLAHCLLNMNLPKWFFPPQEYDKWLVNNEHFYWLQIHPLTKMLEHHSKCLCTKPIRGGLHIGVLCNGRIYNHCNQNYKVLGFTLHL
jgi:hypothetical protein